MAKPIVLVLEKSETTFPFVKLDRAKFYGTGKGIAPRSDPRTQLAPFIAGMPGRLEKRYLDQTVKDMLLLPPDKRIGRQT